MSPADGIMIGIFIGFALGTAFGIRFGRTIHRNAGFDEGFRAAKEIYKRKVNEEFGHFRRMSEGARRSMCVECGYTFGTHAISCSKSTPPAA